MQRNASKHFFSTLKAHLNPNPNTYPHFLCVPLVHLSSDSNPRRPFRGRRDESSETDFPNPRRERQHINPEAFFPNMSKDEDLHEKNPRAERGGRFGDLTESDEDELQSSVQFQTSDPQSQREIGQTKDNHIGKHNIEREEEKNKPLGGIGESLFEKLKLGEKEKTEDSENNNSVNPEQQQQQQQQQQQPVPENADEIFRKMKETGLIPNAVSMLDGLCKDGLVHEAMKLFSLMREKGSIPEVVIYTAVVDGFCKAGKPNDAIRIFRKMQKNGIIPNAYSYGLVINWLCDFGLLDDCEKFCVEMFETGHMPNAATFVKLVDLFCKERGREEAERLVKSFQDRNFAIDEKSIREHLDRKGPFDSGVFEVIFGKKESKSPF